MLVFIEWAAFQVNDKVHSLHGVFLLLNTSKIKILLLYPGTTPFYVPSLLVPACRKRHANICTMYIRMLILIFIALFISNILQII